MKITSPIARLPRLPAVRRGATRLLTCLLMSQAAFAQLHKLQDKRTVNVAFLLYDGVEVLDLSGPMDVFLKAGELTNSGYHVYTVAAAEAEIASDGNGALRIRPQYSLRACPPPDLVVVPGCAAPRVMALAADTAFARHELQWLRGQYQAGNTLMSVCSGAFILGQAGVLTGKPVTTHAMMLDMLSARFPATRVQSGKRYVDAGRVITTGGVTAGIDGALYVVSQVSGQKVAQVVASIINYPYPADPLRASGGDVPPGGKVKTAAHPVKKVPQAAPAAKEVTVSPSYDPVCKMELQKRPAATYVHEGKTIGFCSQICQELFAVRPNRYLNP